MSSSNQPLNEYTVSNTFDLEDMLSDVSSTLDESAFVYLKIKSYDCHTVDCSTNRAVRPQSTTFLRKQNSGLFNAVQKGKLWYFQDHLYDVFHTLPKSQKQRCTDKILLNLNGYSQLSVQKLKYLIASSILES
ncbi:hypothetical protein GEMRC1_003410 [Eukaryota sp. GEM-RC1]